MRYPYATVRNLLLRRLRKEEKKWMGFISWSEEIIEKMEEYLKKNKRLTDEHRQIYQDIIRDTRGGIVKAQEELESIRRNMDAVSTLYP